MMRTERTILLRLDFLEDLTIEDVKNNLTLFSFDGRAEAFSLLSHTDASGNRVEKQVDQTLGSEELLELGGDTPYFSYYGLNNPQSTIMNFAYIMKQYDIVIGGEAWDGSFVLRNSFTGGLNLGELSLLEEDITFKKGDHIYIDFILLPWGNGTSQTDENVQYVIEDSVLRPLTVTARREPLWKTFISRSSARKTARQNLRFPEAGTASRSVSTECLPWAELPCRNSLTASGRITYFNTTISTGIRSFTMRTGRTATYLSWKWTIWERPEHSA